MDLYGILGIGRDATASDIRKAYRKKAQKMHPDKGGDSARFQELQKAYEVLSSPSAREQYDASGEIPSSGADVERTQAMVELSNIVQHVTSKAVASGTIATFNLLDEVRAALRAGAETNRRQKADAIRAKEAYTLVNSRISCKDGGDPIIKDIYLQAIAACNTQLGNIAKQEARIAVIHSILDMYEYACPPSPTGGYRQQRMVMGGFISVTSSTAL